MRNDLSTQVAVVGVVIYGVVIHGVVMLALVWWASHHYVRSAATSWRWTTSDGAVEAERSGAPKGLPAESVGQAAQQLGRQEVR